MTETAEKKQKKPGRILSSDEFAAHRAVYFPILGQHIRVTNWDRDRWIIDTEHKKFLNIVAQSTSDWRVVPNQQFLDRLLRCQAFPAKRRPTTCKVTAVCPWCYASEVADLYHEVHAVVRAPENAGKWLVCTERRVPVPIPQRTENMTDVQYIEDIRRALQGVFRQATDLRTQENRLDERRKHIKAALRYADVTRIWIPYKEAKEQKRKKTKKGEAGDTPQGEADKENFEIISKALLVTTDPAPRFVEGEHVKVIDDTLKDSDIAFFLGKTMQQSEAFYKCTWQQKNALMFAKRATRHRVFKTYGTLRGINDETNTAAAD